MAYREILFRGKPAKKQVSNLVKSIDEIFPDGWIYGFYCPETCDHPFGKVKPDPHIIATGAPDKIITGMWFEVNEETVGQYTGFTDKNGKKIFEGDIVTLSYMGDKLYAVIWAEDQARFLMTDGETVEDFDDFYVFETEVVGNIHDNPDIAPKCEV